MKSSFFLTFLFAFTFTLTGCDFQNNDSDSNTSTDPSVRDEAANNDSSDDSSNSSDPSLIKEKQNEEDQEREKDAPPPVLSLSEDYVGSEYKGNYVWGGAMNLAWTDLSENIIGEDIELSTNDEVALEMVEKLNDVPFSKEDLDEESYYIKSGYGPETLEEINRESRKKFPSKSFKDLDFDMGPTDILAYAYFLKEVEYAKKFIEDTMSFDDEEVKSFFADDYDQKKNVKVLFYEDDDHFLIRLTLKDENDELLVGKGYNMTAPEEMVGAIQKYDKNVSDFVKSDEPFEVPKLHLDIHRDYTELIEKFLKNAGFEDYFIAQMFENIKFDMDEAGARVENEAVIHMEEITAGPLEEEKKPRRFILNKPFWVAMKRTDSQNPYFLLGVKNTELMEKNDE